LKTEVATMKKGLSIMFGLTLLLVCVGAVAGEPDSGEGEGTTCVCVLDQGVEPTAAVGEKVSPEVMPVIVELAGNVPATNDTGGQADEGVMMTVRNTSAPTPAQVDDLNYYCTSPDNGVAPVYDYCVEVPLLRLKCPCEITPQNRGDAATSSSSIFDFDGGRVQDKEYVIMLWRMDAGAAPVQGAVPPV